MSGSRLLSRAVPSTVPSAARALTFVFGVGTRVPPGRIAARLLPHMHPLRTWTAMQPPTSRP